MVEEKEEKSNEEIMIEAFRENRGKLERALDDILQTRLRTDKGVLVELQNLYEEKREAFLPVIWGSSVGEPFLDDIESKTDGREELEEFIDGYPELADDFDVLYSEISSGESYPLTGGRFRLSLSPYEDAILIRLKERSGSQTQYETRMRLGRLLARITSLLEYFIEGLKKIEEDEDFPDSNKIADFEANIIRSQTDNLSEVSRQITDKVEELFPKGEEE